MLRAGEFSQKRPQRLHVLHVFLQLFAFWRFEDLWNFAKAPVAHYDAERFQSDLPLADVFVPIDPRAARGFRIVQMQRDEPLEPNGTIKFGEHSFR